MTAFHPLFIEQKPCILRPYGHVFKHFPSSFHRAGEYLVGAGNIKLKSFPSSFHRAVGHRLLPLRKRLLSLSFLFSSSSPLFHGLGLACQAGSFHPLFIEQVWIDTFFKFRYVFTFHPLFIEQENGVRCGPWCGC